MANNIWGALAKSSHEPLLKTEVDALAERARDTYFFVRDVIGLGDHAPYSPEGVIRRSVRAVREEAHAGDGLAVVKLMGVVVGARAVALGLIMNEEGYDSSAYHLTYDEMDRLEDAQARGRRAVETADGLVSPFDDHVAREVEGIVLSPNNRPNEYAELLGHYVGVRAGLLAAERS